MFKTPAYFAVILFMCVLRVMSTRTAIIFLNNFNICLYNGVCPLWSTSGNYIFKHNLGSLPCNKLCLYSLISGFRRHIDKICPLRRYYAASCGNCVPTFRDNVSIPSSRIKNFKTSWSFSSWTSWPLRMGPIRCPENSVNYYHTTLRNIPEECRSYVCIPCDVTSSMALPFLYSSIAISDDSFSLLSILMLSTEDNEASVHNDKETSRLVRGK
jgi:hypothetical protein